MTVVVKCLERVVKCLGFGTEGQQSLLDPWTQQNVHSLEQTETSMTHQFVDACHCLVSVAQGICQPCHAIARFAVSIETDCNASTAEKRPKWELAHMNVADCFMQAVIKHSMCLYSERLRIHKNLLKMLRWESWQISIWLIQHHSF